MNKLRRILKGKIGFTRYMPNPFHWYGFGIQYFWNGRIVHIKVGIGDITFDWRGDFLKDMATGRPE